MQTAIIILGFAALGGITLAGMRFSGTLIPPTWMALGHGAVAATGLGFLFAAAVGSTVPTLVHVALGVFILAALGGATIFVGFHLQKKPLPIPLIILHGLTAVVGYVLLLIGAYGSAL